MDTKKTTEKKKKIKNSTYNSDVGGVHEAAEQDWAPVVLQMESIAGGSRPATMLTMFLAMTVSFRVGHFAL